MLLTNLRVDRLGPLWTLQVYLPRWKCEQSYRFVNQAYNFEDIRVLRYTALRNMMVLVQAVCYFVSVPLGKKLKLNFLLKKIYEDVSFSWESSLRIGEILQIPFSLRFLSWKCHKKAKFIKGETRHLCLFFRANYNCPIWTTELSVRLSLYRV